MNGFARFPALAGALVAFVLIGGPARGEFLTEAKATLNAESVLAGSVAGSNLTLTASYIPAAGEAGAPVDYAWTLAFAQPGQGPGDTPSFVLSSQATGVSLAGQVATMDGFTEPVVGFSTLGSTVSFELSGAITPGGADALTNYDIGVIVNTATSVIDIATVPVAYLGPIVLTGSLTPVPEPATVALVGVGGLLLIVTRLGRRLRREG
jgi:hypothetical protein